MNAEQARKITHDASLRMGRVYKVIGNTAEEGGSRCFICLEDNQREELQNKGYTCRQVWKDWDYIHDEVSW